MRDVLFGLGLLCSVSCSTSPLEDSQRVENQPPFPSRREPIASAGRTLGYVSNSLSDSISILDLDELRTLGERSIGRNPVDIDGPHHLAIDVASSSLYVALSYPPPTGASGPHAGHGETARYGYVQRLALEDLRPLGEQRVEPNPGDLALSPDGSQLFVSHFDLRLAQEGEDLDAKRAALLAIEDPTSLGQESAMVPRARSLCIAPHAIVYAADGSRAFVTCAREDSVVSVDTRSLDVVERVPVSDHVGAPNQPEHEPYAATLSPDGGTLLVSNLASRTVASFAVGSGLELTSTLSVLGSPYFPAWFADGARAVVPLQNPDGAALIDTTSGEVALDVLYAEGECEAPHEARITDLGRVFLVCEGDHVMAGSVVEIDPETLEVTRRLAVGIYPDRMVVREPR